MKSITDPIKEAVGAALTVDEIAAAKVKSGFSKEAAGRLARIDILVAEKVATGLNLEQATRVATAQIDRDDEIAAAAAKKISKSDKA